MGKLKINHYVVGPVQTNCYFAINEETKELIIIDPGDAAKQLSERIRKEGQVSRASLPREIISQVSRISQASQISQASRAKILVTILRFQHQRVLPMIQRKLRMIPKQR